MREPKIPAPRTCPYSALFILLFSAAAHAQWKQTAGPEGGRILSVAANASYLYAGGQYGIHRSGDKGETWTRLEDPLVQRAIAGMAVKGPYVFASPQWSPFILRSADNGWTWSEARLPVTDVQSLTVNGNDVLAGAYEGIFRSSDDGITWVKTHATGTAWCIAADGPRVYAGSADDGFLRSDDSGKTWIRTVLPEAHPKVTALAMSGKRLLASAEDGTYRSENGGETWTHPSEAVSGQPSGFMWNGTTLLAFSQGGGFAASTDFGATWQGAAGLPMGTNISSIGVGGGGLYAGTYGYGLYRSQDGGRTWKPANKGLILSEPMSLASAAGSVFVSTLGSGAYRSSDAGAHWLGQPAFGNYSELNLATYGALLLMGTGQGIYRSADNGATWTREQSESASFPVTGLAMVGETLFAGSAYEGIFRSQDKGVTWSRVTDWPTVPDGKSAANVHTMAAVGGAILASTGGGVFRSSDLGATWKESNTGLIDSTGADPRSGARIIGYRSFIAGGGYAYLATDSGLFRYSNTDDTWSRVGKGVLPERISCAAVSGNSLFAGTRDGVFRSWDNGAGWTSVSQGLQSKDVTDMTVSGDALYIGVFGEGVWKRSLEELSVSLRRTRSGGSGFAGGAAGWIRLPGGGMWISALPSGTPGGNPGRVPDPPVFNLKGAALSGNPLVKRK